MFGEGNFDSEGGGGAQTFVPMPGGGNVQSDTANLNAATFSGFEFKSNPQLDYFKQIGQQLMQMQAQQQAVQQPVGGGSNLSSGNLTSGFDHTWLAGRLAAASANGAKIT